MPSPFPGMNPFLENDDPWHTFHENFCTKCMEVLVPQVRPRYIVQTDENVYIHEFSAEERQPAIDVVRDTFLTIRDRKSREQITVIELLSPTNKRNGGDREQYLAKRRQYFLSNAHFLEIDLLRGGSRMPLNAMPDCDYSVAVSRVEERPRVAVWPLRLRDRLPSIRVPLRPGDVEPEIDLQAVLHQVYDAFGFEDYIYENDPQPPLHPDDAAWAKQLLAERGG